MAVASFQKVGNNRQIWVWLSLHGRLKSRPRDNKQCSRLYKWYEEWLNITFLSKLNLGTDTKFIELLVMNFFHCSTKITVHFWDQKNLQKGNNKQQKNNKIKGKQINKENKKCKGTVIMWHL